MKAYKLLKLNSDTEYVYLVVMCTANSPYDYLDSISIDLGKINFSGKVLLDQMMHTGNTEKRFIKFDFDKHNLLNGEYVNIKKDSSYRKTVCEYLQNSNYLDGSILTSIQRRMIQKGITI